MTSSFKEESRKLISIAWPVILGQLGHVTVGVADSAMIGRTGAVPLAASAFANSIFVLPLVFGIGVAYGITPLVANAVGQNDTSRIGRILNQGLIINFLLAIALVIFLFLLKPLTAYMRQEEEVLALAIPYLEILIMGILPLMLFLSLKQFAEGLSDTKPAMYISLGANLINVVLNYLLIYGKFGFPEMGIIGAGYATLISRTLMLFGMLIFIARHPRYAIYRSELIPRGFEPERIKRILKLGVPSGLQYIFEVGAFAMAAVLIGTLGAIPLASHQIAISLASISYMAASGIGAASTVRVGNSKGRRDYKGIKQTGRVAALMAVFVMGLSGLIFGFGRNLLPSFYTDEVAVIALSSQLLIVAVLFQLFDGLQVVALGMLRGMEDVKIPTFITFAVYWAVSLPMAWFVGLYMKGGILGIWIVLAFSLVLAALLLGWRFIRLTNSQENS